MQEIIKDWFLSYGIILGKRFTEKQKNKFILRAKAEFENMGYSTEISETEIINKGFGKKTYNNLYVGDFTKSKVLIYTYYDTPAKKFFNKHKFAFNSNYDKKDTIFGLFLGIIFVFITCLILTNIIQPNIELNGIFSLWGLSFILLCMIAFSLINKYKFGISERNNIERNTSSIIAIMTLASSLREDYRDKVCFAFVDEGTRSEIGIKILDKYSNNKNKIKIYLDSVGGDGETYILSDKKYSFLDSIKMNEKYKKYGNILITRGELVDEDIELHSTKNIEFDEFENRNIKIVSNIKFIIEKILK